MKSLNSMLKQAKKLIDEKEYKQALKILGKCMKTYGEEDFRIFLLAGVCGIEMKSENVKQVLEKAFRLSGEKSVDALKGLLTIEPENVEYLKLLRSLDSEEEEEYVRTLLSLTQEYEKRVPLLEWLTQKYPLDFELNVELASLYLKQERKLITKLVKQEIKKEEESRKVDKVKRLMKKKHLSQMEAESSIKNMPMISDSELEDMQIVSMKKHENNLLSKSQKFDELIETMHFSKMQLPREILLTYTQRLVSKLSISQNIEYLERIIELCKDRMNEFPSDGDFLKILLLLQESDTYSSLVKDEQQTKRLLVRLYPDFPISKVIYAELLMENNFESVDEVLLLFDSSLQLQSSSSMFHFDNASNYLSGWLKYGQLAFNEQKFKMTISISEKSLLQCAVREKVEHIRFHHFSTKFTLLKADALRKLHQYQQSENDYKFILKEDSKNIAAYVGLAKLQILQNKSLALQTKILSKILLLDSKNEFANLELGWIKYNEDEYSSALEYYLVVEQNYPNNWKLHYRKGLLYWKMGMDHQKDKKFAHNSFFTSARLNPHFSSNFAYLGHHYNLLGDFDRAIKCYQRAIELNPSESDAGVNLADIFIQKGQEDKALNVYDGVTKRNPKAAWAWRRLAFYYQGKYKHEDALRCFQFALRAIPNDPMIWEGLGETYQVQGKYLAALRSYDRALKADPNRIYSLSQIGYIHKLLGELRKTEAIFSKVLEKDPEFIHGYLGMGSVLLEIGRGYYDDGILEKCESYLLKAEEVLLKCTRKFPTLISAWKLLGNVQLFSHHLPHDSETRRRMMDIVTDSFLKCINLEPKAANNQYDLGVAYFYLGDKEKAISSIRKAILLSSSAEYWNALGCLYDDTEKKQHCFIQAIEKKTQYHDPWNNLGFLYLERGELTMAHKSFVNAQNINPSNHLSWLGLGIIHELKAGIEINESRDHMLRARNAYIHSFDLQPTAESALGSIVSSLITNNLERILDFATKYTQLHSDDALGWNLYGIALENLGLFQEADNFYQEALNKFPGSSVSTEILPISNLQSMKNSISFSEMVPEDLKLRILVNRRRVLIKLRKFSEADDVLPKDTKLDSKALLSKMYLDGMLMRTQACTSTFKNLLQDAETKEPALKLMIMLYSESKDEKMCLKTAQTMARLFPSSKSYILHATLLGVDGISLLDQCIQAYNSGNNLNMKNEEFLDLLIARITLKKKHCNLGIEEMYAELNPHLSNVAVQTFLAKELISLTEIPTTIVREVCRSMLSRESTYDNMINLKEYIDEMMLLAQLCLIVGMDKLINTTEIGKNLLHRILRLEPTYQPALELLRDTADEELNADQELSISNEKDPKQWIMLANVLATQKKYASAVLALENALVYAPKRIHCPIYLQMASLSSVANDAAKFAKMAVDLQPDSWNAHLLFAKLLVIHGNFLAAQEEYLIARNLCPENESIHQEYYQYLLEQNQHEEAEKSLNDAIVMVGNPSAKFLAWLWHHKSHERESIESRFCDMYPNIDFATFIQS